VEAGGGKRLVEAGGGKKVDAGSAKSAFEEEREVAEETLDVAAADEAESDTTPAGEEE
jgi:hypothetical protein